MWHKNPEDWFRQFFEFPEISAPQEGHTQFPRNSVHSPKNLEISSQNHKHAAAKELEALGALVVLPEGKNFVGGEKMWEELAGYEDVKRRVEDAVVLGLKFPEIFRKIAEKTRQGKSAPNRPKIVLFEGPPGTGKTSTARIISNVSK